MIEESQVLEGELSSLSNLEGDVLPRGPKGDPGRDGAIQYTAGTGIEITNDNTINATGTDAPVIDVKVDNVSVVTNKVANINLSNVVQDNDYVHTDNNYDNTEKENVASNTTARHTHSNKETLDGITSNDISNWNNKAEESDIPDVSNFITNSVNDLVNYYLKSETYTKSEVNTLITNINQFSVLVVENLPTEDIDTHTIYLVPKEAETNDNYDEYIYINNSWEHIGNTSVDLSDYYTKTEADNRYLQSETDPTVPSWAKAETKPSYAYSEIENTPDIPVNSDFTLNGLSEKSYNSLTDTPTIPSPYTLPIASDSILGGIKIGENLSIDENGVLSGSGGGGLPVIETTTNIWELTPGAYVVKSGTTLYGSPNDNWTLDLDITLNVGANNVISRDYSYLQGILLWYGMASSDRYEYTRKSLNLQAVLMTANTTSYNVQTDYNPAHKKYVDDNTTKFLSANRDIYVSGTGSDTETGASGSPYRTIQKAINMMPLNLNGYTGTIHIGAGTYDENITINGFYGGLVALDFASDSIVGGGATTRSLIITNSNVRVLGTPTFTNAYFYASENGKVSLWLNSKFVFNNTSYGFRTGYGGSILSANSTGQYITNVTFNNVLFPIYATSGDIRLNDIIMQSESASASSKFITCNSSFVMYNTTTGTIAKGNDISGGGQIFHS